jgi:hypothetical protein
MWQYAVKVLIAAAAVVAVSERGKRSSFWGALLASRRAQLTRGIA